MKMLLLVGVTALAASAQTGVITASSTRTVNLAPEEAVVNVEVITTSPVPFERILETLQPAGVKAEQLLSATVDSGRNPSAPLVYNYRFQYSVAPRQLSKVVSALHSLTQPGQADGTSISATGSLRATEAAIEATRVTLLPTMYADARRRADQWRQAAGSGAGEVVFANSLATEASGAASTYTMAITLGRGRRVVRVSASRTVVLSPEEVAFRVVATVAPTVKLEDLLEMLAPAGITREDWQPQEFGAPTPPSTFVFSTKRSLDNMEQTLRALDPIRRNLPTGVTSFQFSAGAVVSDVTLALLRDSVRPQLEQEARVKAAPLAQLMGGRLGAVLRPTDPDRGFPAIIIATTRFSSSISNLAAGNEITLEFEVE